MEIKDFLKKYTSISNIFIEDFFNLYNYNTSETDFVIQLMQKTTSGTPVSVSGSLTFNITFTQII